MYTSEILSFYYSIFLAFPPMEIIETYTRFWQCLPCILLSSRIISLRSTNTFVSIGEFIPATTSIPGTTPHIIQNK